MQKLQSGISGELEPLRRLGYDLSQAKLQAIALSAGIDKTVSSMTQAEKAELRYLAIMTQVTTAQGDMARTLESPANQIRIFQAALTQCARALGNIFIPALNAVLPYAIAFVNVIRWVASEISSLFGYDAENWKVEWDSGGITSGAEDIENGFNGATDAVKELKKEMLGIDELNIIGANASSGSGINGINHGGGFDFKLPEYDFLGDLVEGKTAKVFEKWKKKIKPFVDYLVKNFDSIKQAAITIGAAMLAWKISESVIRFV